VGRGGGGNHWIMQSNQILLKTISERSCLNLKLPPDSEISPEKLIKSIPQAAKVLVTFPLFNVQKHPFFI
jgi:hypothetical protein